MDPKKKKRLEANGWTVGSVEDLLGLSPLQLAYVDLTIYLAEQVKRIRKNKGLTQTALANLMGSSQSRIAKLERGDSSVSFDLMLRAFINLGVAPHDLGWMILEYKGDDPLTRFEVANKILEGGLNLGECSQEEEAINPLYKKATRFGSGILEDKEIDKENPS